MIIRDRVQAVYGRSAGPYTITTGWRRKGAVVRTQITYNGHLLPRRITIRRTLRIISPGVASRGASRS